MEYSTLTQKFQTTIPRAVRDALLLKPGQRLCYEVRTGGSVILTGEPDLNALFASLKLTRPVASSRVEKQKSRKAIAHSAAGEGRP